MSTAITPHPPEVSVQLPYGDNGYGCTQCPARLYDPTITGKLAHLPRKKKSTFTKVTAVDTALAGALDYRLGPCVCVCVYLDSAVTRLRKTRRT